jgi:hypothetical protein
LTVCATCSIFSCIASMPHHEDHGFFEFPSCFEELERAETTRSEDIVRRAVGLEVRRRYSFAPFVDGPGLGGGIHSRQRKPSTYQYQTARSRLPWLY